MNSSKHENSPAKKTANTYESTVFSRPAIDQLDGILPDFNRRLSPELNLGLSPAGQPRLSHDAHPRLFSGSCIGLLSSHLPEIQPKELKIPVGKGLEIKPDLAGRSLAGAKLSPFIGADLPIASLGSRLVTLSATEEKLKSTEKERKYL
jgi:hypothetical protein